MSDSHIHGRPTVGLDPALRAELIELLAPDVERLGRLVGRDLVSFWWDRPADLSGMDST